MSAQAEKLLTDAELRRTQWDACYPLLLELKRKYEEQWQWSEKFARGEFVEWPSE